MIHQVNPELHTKKVRVLVVGCGGNGAQVVSGLARLHTSMIALGHPGGLEVTVVDPDIVTEANVGRQLFSMSDVGQFKAAVLVGRINAFYGLDWKAQLHEWRGPHHIYDCDILIGCVDNRDARVRMHQCTVDNSYAVKYWLDLGNDAFVGQVVLGEGRRTKTTIKADEFVNGVVKFKHNGTPHDPRLPTVCDLYPQLLHGDFKEDKTPSCSLAGALRKQELFINQAVSTFALNLLWRMFRYGLIDHHGGFINLETGATSPLPINFEVWERMGYYPFAEAPLRKIKRTLKKPGCMRDGRFLLECGHKAWGRGKKRVRCHLCPR